MSSERLTFTASATVEGTYLWNDGKKPIIYSETSTASATSNLSQIEAENSAEQLARLANFLSGHKVLVDFVRKAPLEDVSFADQGEFKWSFKNKLI